MLKSTYHISGMDCSSEEQLIRMKLEPLGNITTLKFDLQKRMLEVYHDLESGQITNELESLDMNAKHESTIAVDETPVIDESNIQRKVLWQVLAINFAFFLLEMTTGIISSSMGLVADSLDMLADSLVYSLALFAVGGTIAYKKNIAKTTGYFQLTLAIIGIVELLRRFFWQTEVPDFQTMIIVSIAALVANAVSLYLIQKSRSKEVHMTAVAICTSNDILINFGVIVAGVLVYLTSSKYPDLIIGSIVFVLVLRGVMRILKLAK